MIDYGDRSSSGTSHGHRYNEEQGQRPADSSDAIPVRVFRHALSGKLLEVALTSLTVRFNEHINNRDLEGMAQLMTATRSSIAALLVTGVPY